MEIFEDKKSDLNVWRYFILMALLGIFGVHKFYLGKKGIGLAYLFTLGYGGFGLLTDELSLAFGPYIKDSKGKILVLEPKMKFWVGGLVLVQFIISIIVFVVTESSS